MSRFNSSVPMDDSPRGFFGILNEFFDQLAAEEAAASEWAGIPATIYPPFGKATDDYTTVARPFYNAWAGFSTRKSFSWRDKYRLQDAPDRRIRRLMEKENKKFREEGIREFNDAVQSLVAFVKKRDPRYVPSKQSEAERQQVLRNSAAAQAARSRAANQEKLGEYVVPDWAQARDGEEQENDEFALSEEESEVEQIECVVCNKTFKSEKQFEAHEKSKKHVKAVQQLRRQMRKENANLDLEDTEAASSPALTPGRGTEDEGDVGSPGLDVPHQENDVKDVKEDVQSPTGDGIDHGTPSLSDSDDDEYASRSAVEERILNGKGTSIEVAWSEPDEGIAAVDSTATGMSDLTLNEGKGDGKKIGKAKLKREKKAARQAADAGALDSVRLPADGPQVYLQMLPNPTDSRKTSISAPSARRHLRLGPSFSPISRSLTMPLRCRIPRAARRNGAEYPAGRRELSRTTGVDSCSGPRYIAPTAMSVPQLSFLSQSSPERLGGIAGPAWHGVAHSNPGAKRAIGCALPFPKRGRTSKLQDAGSRRWNIRCISYKTLAFHDASCLKNRVCVIVAQGFYFVNGLGPAGAHASCRVLWRDGDDRLALHVLDRALPHLPVILVFD